MPANIMTIVTWALRLLVAAAFLFFGFMKLSGNPMMVEELGRIGLGDWLLYFTGACEVIGAILVLIPGFTGFGALLLLCVDIGAFFAQAFILHGDVVHTIVIGAVVATLLYLTRHQVTNAVSGRA